MAVRIRSTSKESQSTEMMLVFEEILSLMNLMGVDTTDVSKLNCKMVKGVGTGNETTINLPSADMVSGDHFSFGFGNVIYDVGEEVLTITGVTIL